MIGESGGLTSLVYQDQVSRENQIQREQAERQGTEEKSSRHGSSDVASFSAEGLELARIAVTATEATPGAVLEQKTQKSQEEEQAAAPVYQANNSSPAQHLDITV